MYKLPYIMILIYIYIYIYIYIVCLNDREQDPNMTREDCQALVLAVDADNNGQVDFEEVILSPNLKIDQNNHNNPDFPTFKPHSM